MSEDTTGTSPDPEYGGEGDNDQIAAEDSLIDRGVEDPLDEGYDPLDRPRTNHWGETPLEEEEGESLDLRLSEEEPESWDDDTPVDADRAGRIAEDDDALDGRGNDVFAVDEGISGAGAGAEEAAVHVVEDEDAEGDWR
jgi:hypothetical protein